MDGIAVTRGPGLVGSLLVGLMCAKGLAQTSGLPMVGVNHIEGHLLAPMLEQGVPMPFLALVVSGGHTALFMVEDFGRYRMLGQTRDDAAGEAFDKVAKLMRLGYPGGRIIDELARRGNRKCVRLPRARVKGAPLDFSFSGIKTAVASFLSARPAPRLRRKIWRQASRRPWSICCRPTIAAARETGVDTIALTGGVAANSRLRERLGRGRLRRGAPIGRAVDKLLHRNAAMIALAGSYRLLRGERDSLAIDAEANLAL